MSPVTSTTSNGNSATGIRFILRALRSRNYRLFFVGQGTSLVGTWMTRAATLWLVALLSVPDKRGLWLGVVGFVGQVPTFLLAPVAGALVDRWNRHRVLVVTQVLAMAQSFLLAYFALRGTISIVHIILLNAFQGLINAFDIPARQAFVMEMVENRDDLSNAIALNSSMVNGARLVGPAIAGVLMAAVGAGLCFLLDGVSYMAVVASLLAMRLAPRSVQRKQGHVWREMREGFVYAFGFPPIRAILLLMALVSLMAVPYMVLMPIFAADILHGGPRMMGWLMSAAGAGALVGALSLAARRSVVGLGRVIALSAGMFGVGLIAFSFSSVWWISMPLLLVTGYSMIVQMAASNTVLQTISDEDKRGRVMSFFTMAFMGTAPFGSLLAGGLTRWIGAPRTVMIGGMASVVGAGLFAQKLPALRKLVHPIYVRRGILPEVAVGIQAATAMTTPPEE